MFIAGSDDINSCGVDTAVTENICELGDVFFDAIEGPCKKVAQIMGNTFCGFTPACTQRLFISRQILVRLIGLPLRVINIAPVIIFCSAA